MVLSDTQKTRYDVDVIDVTTLTKELDKFPTLQSPFIIDMNDYYDSSVNVFIKDDDGLKSNGFKGTDTLVFHLDCSELVMKNILSLNVSCTFESDIRFTVNKIGIVDEISTFTPVEKVINKQGDIDENIDISSISNEELIYLIEAKKFKVFIEISSDLDIGSINLTENILTCEFDKILEDEILAVDNRLSGSLDFFIDDDEIILQIGDGNGKGRKGDNPTPTGDTYTKAEIDSKLALKVDIESGKQLSSNDFTTSEKWKLANIENNANYYAHPSTHSSSIIVEGSELDNLNTDVGATQHEINVAIDTIIGSAINYIVGSGS